MYFNVLCSIFVAMEPQAEEKKYVNRDQTRINQVINGFDQSSYTVFVFLHVDSTNYIYAPIILK